METIVGVTSGTDKIACFRELLEITNFDAILSTAWEVSKKAKSDYSVVIKPNMMVFINPVGHTATVTDKDLVEYLIDHILALGFSNISICEAQHDVSGMLKNHNAMFVAEQIGYRPNGRYKVADLTLEPVKYNYAYKDRKGNLTFCNDTVGYTWMNADFRISFAKCKTHKHDWMTLSVKNIYGCYPTRNKVKKYHIKSEVWDATALSFRNFPVHFAFVDAWIASDRLQGFKIAHPQDLKMLFGGENAIAVDTEIFKRAGLDPLKSRILNRTVIQAYNGVYPIYRVTGNTSTYFNDLCNWENVTQIDIDRINKIEESLINWGLMNLGSSKEVDANLFPPKNKFYRFVMWLTKKLFSLAVKFNLYRKIYGMES
jgi:uncharacterized protein (DUF362 family)